MLIGVSGKLYDSNEKTSHTIIINLGESRALFGRSNGFNIDLSSRSPSTVVCFSTG